MHLLSRVGNTSKYSQKEGHSIQPIPWEADWGLHSVGGGPSVEAGRSEESVVLTVGSSDGHELAKAVEIGRREEMEVLVAVFADRLPVTWKGVRAYQLVFS